MEQDRSGLSEYKHLFEQKLPPEFAARLSLGVKGVSGDDFFDYLADGFLPAKPDPSEQISRPQYLHFYEATKDGVAKAGIYARVRGVKRRLASELSGVKVSEEDIYEKKVSESFPADKVPLLEEIYETTGGMLVLLDPIIVAANDFGIEDAPEQDEGAKVLVANDWGKFPIGIVQTVIPLGDYERDLVSREIGA